MVVAILISNCVIRYHVFVLNNIMKHSLKIQLNNHTVHPHSACQDKLDRMLKKKNTFDYELCQLGELTHSFKPCN